TVAFAKRPADFFVRWLENSAAINRHHRMPVFSFTSDELKSLDLWAREKAAGTDKEARKAGDRPELLKHGEKLVSDFRCAACHALSGKNESLKVASQKQLIA